MKEPGMPDALTVINGPEDGAEFPILRVPLAVGQDPTCGVQIRLDRAVQPVHARISAVPDGYRVRCTTGSAAHVNGRKVGRARSRTIRNGEILKIGHTELVLECAPDGLASRSRGISTEGDAMWLVKETASLASRVVVNAAQWTWAGALAVARGPKLMLAAAAAGVLVFWPEARYWVIAIVRVVAEDVQALLQ